MGCGRRQYEAFHPEPPAHFPVQPRLRGFGTGSTARWGLGRARNGRDHQRQNSRQVEKSKAQSSQTEEYQAGRDQRESLLTIGQASQDRNASSGSVKGRLELSRIRRFARPTFPGQ